ncbi:site-specific DNA-methyltransferase [Gordonia sp. N1V]|uniref:DNA-methyltransferase n=1 Tax=Gordonia sp. N1V TaxID=3034163 RepID=UPI0023E223C8|nr:site-specific DNA-methyltransferase [Gordonia sp. N1V]MDF3280866.1 site-specific DNA-methyltransferase [Gordonia sp. N1V]
MTAPYYEDELITLYKGNCLDLAHLWVVADVLITDPPYGMAFNSGQKWQSRDEFRERAIAGDNTTDARDDVLAAWGTKPAAMFGTWRVQRPAAVAQILIWNKAGAGPGMGDVRSAFGTSHEEIYLFGTWLRGENKRMGSVITTTVSPSAMTSAVGHPTPKPVSLMETLVSRAPAGVIAEPFAGSGSTLLAARNLGRRAIGVEIEEKYCEIIANRLSQNAFALEEL